MRILHVNATDVAGGAARASYRLHTGLKRLGHDSRFFVGKRWSAEDPNTTLFEPPTDLVSRVKRKLRRKRIEADFARYDATRPAGLEPFRDDRTEHTHAVVEQLKRLLPADIINLHWISGFIDHPSFFPALPKDIPLVWRLADMAPCTGGCHYDHDCGRVENKCGACPQLGSRDENDLSRQIWQRKYDALRAHGKINLVATSNWIAQQSRRSSLLRDFPVTVIPNGLDTDDFAPRDRKFARDMLGVPQDARVVLFAAESINVKRKGFALLLDALAGLQNDPDLVLLSVGGMKEPIKSPVRQIALGRIGIDRYLSLAYSAADVFVIASLQESFGQTVSESLACGTPVIGFATGGMLDMVRPGETGQLVPVGDVAALREAIRSMLAIPNVREQYSARCREIAVNEYSMHAQATAYVRLYESLIAGPHVAPAPGIPPTTTPPSVSDAA
jgi:glycosyltransferase involved in cell wall biosynthesis